MNGAVICERRDSIAMNPYEPTQAFSPKPLTSSPGWLNVALIAYAVPGTIFPLPFMIWLGDNEPFMYPDAAGVGVCMFSFAMGIGWVAWSLLITFAIARGWYSKSKLGLLFLAGLFGAWWFFDGCLYLSDPADKRMLGIVE